MTFGWPSRRTWGVVIKDLGPIVAVLDLIAKSNDSSGLPREWIAAAGFLSYLLGSLVKAWGEQTAVPPVNPTDPPAPHLAEGPGVPTHFG